MAFISEFDFLFESIQQVYEGRLLENAVGEQLDIIGVILGQSRSVILPQFWFGFVGALDVTKMADEATPAEGGMFKSEGVGAGAVTPLDDETYRRLLKAKASLLNSETIDVNTTYHFVSVLLGMIPGTFKLTDLGSRKMELTLANSEVSDTNLSLILYATKYFVPAGVTFTINQV
jgi:hypothetical protein